MEPANCRTGCQYLRHYLDSNDFSLARLDRPGLRRWLRQQIEHRGSDPVFVQRCVIRDLQKRHLARLVSLQCQLKQATANFAACPDQETIGQLEYSIKGCKEAVAGLEQAVSKSTGAKRRSCQQKLAQYRHKLLAMQKEWQQLWEHTPEKRELQQAEAVLADFSKAIGLSDEQQKLETLLRQRGRRHSQSGSDFEQQVLSIVKERVIPWAQNHFGITTEFEPEILSRVRLGCARAEFDYLVVISDQQPQMPVQVLAVVEVKRNPNDLVNGFLHRQENLAWFTQTRSGYPAESYRTNIFRHGHFDRPAQHAENGRKYVFTHHSFVRFRQERHHGYFLDGLFFITRSRPLLGMTSSEHSRLLYKISTDVHFDLDNDDYLERLWQWCQQVIADYQSKDVLMLYASQPHWSEQIVFLRDRPDSFGPDPANAAREQKGKPNGP